MRQQTIDGLLITRPTREDVEDLKVGDLAPDCFGRMSRVTRIFAQREDVKGLAFVCYYTQFGSDAGSEISGSMKQDETVATVPLTSKYMRSEFFPQIA